MIADYSYRNQNDTQMNDVAAITPVVTADQIEQSRHEILAARGVTCLHTLPELREDSRQDKGDHPQSENRCGMHAMRPAPDDGKEQRSEEWNPHCASKRTGSLLAPGKEWSDTHEQHKSEEQWAGNALEVWRSNRDLGASDQFTEERKDGSPENREG